MSTKFDEIKSKINQNTEDLTKTIVSIEQALNGLNNAILIELMLKLMNNFKLASFEMKIFGYWWFQWFTRKINYWSSESFNE